MANISTIETKEFESFAAFIRGRKDNIKAAFANGVNIDRLLKVILWSAQDNPKLLACNKETVYSAITKAGAMGLEINPATGLAYLVPYKVQGVSTAKLIIGYRGYMSLTEEAIPSWEVGVIYKDSVYKYRVCGDQTIFDIDKGRELNRESEPTFDDVIAAYTIAIKKDGSRNVHVIPKWQIVKAKNKAAYQDVWKEFPIPQAIKTCIRDHCKYIPLPLDVREKLAADDDDIIDVGPDLETSVNAQADNISDRVKKAKKVKPEDVISPEVGEEEAQPADTNKEPENNTPYCGGPGEPHRIPVGDKVQMYAGNPWCSACCKAASAGKSQKTKINSGEQQCAGCNDIISKLNPGTEIAGRIYCPDCARA